MVNLDFTYEEAEKLIHTPKFILESDGTECTSKAMNFVTGFSETVILMSEDRKVYFKWSIRQSPKEIIKLSLNVIDKDSNNGVFRVDYVAPSARHQNPVEMTDDVPEQLKPYCGAEIMGSHAHFNVAGYKSLVWAVPLSQLDYDVKSITDKNGITRIADAVLCFARYINIKTPIEAQQTLL